MSNEFDEWRESRGSSEDKIEWYEHSHFWTGFIGWFLVNGLIWGFLIFISFELLGLLLIPANIILLLVIAKRQRMVAMGLLAAFSFNLVVVLVQGMFFNAICFVPFFIEIS